MTHSPRRVARGLRSALLLSGSIALFFASPDARGSGLYFGDRGVRPVGRAGAFVAGADDLGAMAYNPAGIYDAGASFILDASWLHFTSNYTRQALLRQVDPNTGEVVATYTQTFGEVQGASPVLPIPTLGLSFQPHPKWVLALGAWAPYAAITSYPDVGPDGKAAPQRYSLLTLEGSALAVVQATAAFAPSKELRLGAGLQMLSGNFNSRVNFSGCLPERFFCSPEEPSWDVLAELKVGPIFAPSGILGAIWAPKKEVRFGASFQLPVYVRASAKLHTRLPAAPLFNQASVTGEDASVAFDLPWVLRLGVEARPTDNLRIEAGFSFDHWSMLDAIHVTPKDIVLNDITGLPKQYKIPPVDLVKGFKDSYSLRLGGEYEFPLLGKTWAARAGVAYESSAVPDDYLSVQTIDMNKLTTSIGASLYIDRFRFDAVYGHIFGFGVNVDPATAKIAQVSVVTANPPKIADTVNGGSYAARADVLGVGLVYTFGQAPQENRWEPNRALDETAPPKKDPAKDPPKDKPKAKKPKAEDN